MAERFKCGNDIFGFRKDKEKREKAKEEVRIRSHETIFSLLCEEDKRTCGSYELFSEQIKPEEFPELEGYRHKLVPKVAEVATKEIKKQTEDKPQGSLF